MINGWILSRNDGEDRLSFQSSGSHILLFNAEWTPVKSGCYRPLFYDDSHSLGTENNLVTRLQVSLGAHWSRLSFSWSVCPGGPGGHSRGHSSLVSRCLPVVTGLSQLVTVSRWSVSWSLVFSLLLWCFPISLITVTVEVGIQLVCFSIINLFFIVPWLLYECHPSCTKSLSSSL